MTGEIAKALVTADYVKAIIEVLGGLALFIWGMEMMGDGLQKAAGDKLRYVLERLTRKPIYGAFVGTVITGIIQSSSAVTVMLVGFVNAGLMNLGQAVGVIFGANIGTTVTAQLVAFNIYDIIFPVIFIGVALRFFGTKKTWKVIGEVLLGFGILFLGMKTMGSSISFLKEDIAIRGFLAQLSGNVFYGMLAGAIFTGIIQSSSATSGLVLAMALNGLISVQGGIGIMMGANIGTCVTALLASIGGNLGARRVAFAHLMFNVLGVAIFIWFAGPVAQMMLFLSKEPARQIANFHTFFNVTMTIIMLPLTTYYVKFIKWMLPGEEIIVERGIKFISQRILVTPSLALEQATQEIVRMMETARLMVLKSKDMLLLNSRKSFKVIIENEDLVDSLQMAITAFLSKLTQKSLSEDQADRAVVLLHAVHDVERIGDHGTNLAELVQGVIEGNVNFSKDAKESLIKLYDTVDEACLTVKEALSKYDVHLAQKMNDIELQIDDQVREMRNAHITRLKSEVCKPEYGIFYLDMASNLERVGDHCLNISQAVTGELSGVTHKTYPELDPS